jgi:hypothetical protein
MFCPPQKLTLDQWDARHAELVSAGLREPFYGGPLRRHVTSGRDLRLLRLQFDNAPAALRLWNFLLTENERLQQARDQGEKIVGTMKDLGTVPVMAYALPEVRAFYPDGAWWTPCLMECDDGLLRQAEALGVDASFCPVRAMLAAFVHGDHFPRPDLLICSSGAVCDDFSAIAQRLVRLGFEIAFWEIPRRRAPETGEPRCALPGGSWAPPGQVEIVRQEFERITGMLGELAGQPLDEARLTAGIRQANAIRRLLARLRQAAYGSAGAPLPALEMLVAEMLAIHFCSDLAECRAVLEELLSEAEARRQAGVFAAAPSAARIYWVNPVADLRVMNLLEDCGGRICGSDYMFSHALDLIPEDLPPLEALARTALADPMVGSARDRAERIARECRENRAEAVVVSRIPGASHCVVEGAIIREHIQETLGIPAMELEVPPVGDAFMSALATRLQAVVETVRAKRTS